jgi:hypothetical protein
VWVPEKTLVKQ